MAEFVTRKENKRRLVTLIACITICTLSLAGGIYAIKGANDIEDGPKVADNIKNLRANIAIKREAVRAAEQKYARFSSRIGWSRSSDISYDRLASTGVHSAQLKAYLDAWVTEILRPGYDVKDFRPWGQEGAGTDLLLTKLFDQLAALEADFSSKNKQIESALRDENQRALQLQRDIDDAQRRSLDEIDRQKDEYRNSLRDHAVKERQNFDALVKLETDTFSKQNELTRLKNENVKKQLALEQQLQDLRTRINWIQYRREEAKERKEPDGEILSVDLKDNIAFIDLLRSDRLFTGTVFKVYSLEKGGLKIDKGEIEVTEPRDELSSRAAITRTYDPSDPIKAGDRIYNEYYEKTKARYFAIAGRLTGKISNEDAARLLREKGDVYQDKVDEKTNYVVLADGFDGPDGDFTTEDQKRDDHPNFRLAREWGVKLLLERTLLEYLGVK